MVEPLSKGTNVCPFSVPHKSGGWQTGALLGPDLSWPVPSFLFDRRTLFSLFGTHLLGSGGQQRSILVCLHPFAAAIEEG